MISDGKPILDACCGGRMMWFNKKHPRTVYIDFEPRDKGTIACRPEFEARPDMVADFRALPFPDKTFKHIVWDPPQLLNLGKTSIMRKKFGSLNTETWRYDLGKGFAELWRVLDEDGTLIFKWNEADIPLNDVLSLFKEQPLYGHPTAKHGKTIWVAFYKEKSMQRQIKTEVSGAEALRTPPTIEKSAGIRIERADGKLHNHPEDGCAEYSVVTRSGLSFHAVCSVCGVTQRVPMYSVQRVMEGDEERWNKNHRVQNELPGRDKWTYKEDE